MVKLSKKLNRRVFVMNGGSSCQILVILLEDSLKQVASCGQYIYIYQYRVKYPFLWMWLFALIDCWLHGNMTMCDVDMICF